MKLRKILKYLKVLNSLVGVTLRVKRERTNARSTVLFNTVRMLPVPMMLEGLLAVLLAKAGCRCYLLIDDDQLNHWDTTQEFQDQSLNLYRQPFINKMPKRLMIRFMLLLLRLNRIVVLKYSTLLRKGNDALVDPSFFHSFARSSTIRYFQTEIMEDRYQWYYNLSMENAAKSYRAAAASNEIISPDVVVTSHGFYSTYGPFRSYYENQGKRVVIYESHPYARGPKITLSEKTPQFFYDNPEWTEFKKKDLSEYETVQIKKYYEEERFGFKGWDTSLFYARTQKKVLAVKEGSLLYGCFPNLIWDANIQERNYIFEGILDWLETTIRFFIDHPDRHLVLRFHPAEANLWVNSASVEDQVKARIPEMYSLQNITVISSQEKVDTYDLVRRQIDISLVYSGTLGMEIPILGKPVIACGKSRYFECGGPYHPCSKKEYIDWLSRPRLIFEDFKQSMEKRRRLTLKFAYWLIYESAYYFPASLDQGIFQLSSRYINYHELNFRRNLEIRRTIERILFGCA